MEILLYGYIGGLLFIPFVLAIFFPDMIEDRSMLVPLLFWPSVISAFAGYLIGGFLSFVWRLITRRLT